MPSQSSNLTTLRADGHKTRGFLSVFTWGEPVAVYTVDTTPTFPAFNLDVTLSSGASADVKPGMLYTVETASGHVRGQGTVRYAGTISDTNLPVRELSHGQIAVAATDVVRVYRYWPLSDKLVDATENFQPDGAAYSTQNSAVRPIANDGGLWVGDSTMLPIPFTGSLSTTEDSDSTGGVTHAYTLPSGLSLESGYADTDADIEVAGDAGTYWVEHVVTDADNSAATTRYVPVKIDDNPLAVVMDSPPTVSPEGGWTVGLRILDSVTYAALPEGALAAFWVKETISGARQSFGAAAPGRSHIKFTGYIRRRRLSGNGQQHQLSIELVSPLTWWQENPNYSKVMIREASPDAWSEVKGLTTRLAKWLIIAHYTNVNEIGYDVVFADNYRDKAYPALYLQKTSAPDQLRELADGVGARLVCDRTGRFLFHTILSLLPLASRAAEVTTLALGEQDIIDYEAELEDRDTVEKMSFRGFTAGASGNQPVVISAPGKAPGRGAQAPVLEKMIVDSIADGEAEAGRRYGIIERVFVDSNGQRRRSPTVNVTLFGSFDVFDLLGEWVTLPDISRIKQADIDLSAFRYEVESIDVAYEGGTTRPRLTLVGETNAPKGQYDPPPPEPSIPPLNPFNPGDWDFDIGTIPDFTIPPVPQFPQSGLGISGLLVAGPGGAHVARAYDPNGLSFSPTFEDRSTGLTGNAVYDLQVDPYNFDRFYAACSNGIWKCDNIAAGTAWTQVLDNSRLDSSSHHYHQVLMSPYRQGWLLAVAGLNHIDVSPDYGATWTTVNGSNGVDARTSTATDQQWWARAEISWHDTQGVIWLGLGQGGRGNVIRKSSNWAASFATAYTIDAALTASVDATRVHVPLLRPSGADNVPNGAQVIIPISGSVNPPTPNAGNLYTTENGGTSFTKRINAAAEAWGARDAANSQVVFGYEDNGRAFALLERDSDANGLRVAFTDDFFTTVTPCTNQPSISAGTGGTLPVNLFGLPKGNPNWLIVYADQGTSGNLDATTDRGNSAWQSILGNLGSLWGTTRISYAQPV